MSELRTHSLRHNTWGGADPNIQLNADGSTSIGNLAVSSINDGTLSGLRNQFINPLQQISRRGASGTGQTAQSYTTDRWYIHADAAATFDWQQLSTVSNDFRNAGLSHRLAITNSTHDYQIRQAVELPGAGLPGQFYPGSTWTVSLYSSQAVDCQIWFANSATFTNGSSTQVQAWTAMTDEGDSRYSLSFTLPDPLVINAAATCFLVSFRRNGDPDGNIQVSGLQLEQGPECTPLELRPIALESDLCKRYYQVIQLRGTTFNRNASSFATAQLNSPVRMRVAPSTNTTQITVNQRSNGTSNTTLDITAISGGALPSYIRMTPSTNTGNTESDIWQIQSETLRLSAEIGGDGS